MVREPNQSYISVQKAYSCLSSLEPFASDYSLLIRAPGLWPPPANTPSWGASFDIILPRSGCSRQPPIWPPVIICVVSSHIVQQKWWYVTFKVRLSKTAASVSDVLCQITLWGKPCCERSYRAAHTACFILSADSHVSELQREFASRFKMATVLADNLTATSWGSLELEPPS